MVPRVADGWNGSTGKTAPGHRPPQVVARPHQLRQFPLPLVFDLDAGLLAGEARHLRAVGELVDPGAVLRYEHDARTSAADVLDNCLRPCVPRDEGPDAVDQGPIGLYRHGRRRIASIWHVGSVSMGHRWRGAVPGPM